MVGVLAVIAILAAILAPSFVRQMDKTAGDQESADLKSFGDALQRSIMRNRYIPNEVDWASRVATELGVDIAAVTTNPRRQPRIFLIDPNLSIAGRTLPYTQTSAGSAEKPVSPRVIILSSIGRDLPNAFNSGLPAAANFNAVWDWNDAGSTLPATSFTWTDWPTNSSYDLKVQRIDLSPLFVELQLTSKVPSFPSYAIDLDNPGLNPVSGSIPDWPGYFIQNSILYLYNHGGELDSQQILIRNNAFVYDTTGWRSNIGGEGYLGGMDIASVVTRYLEAYPNVRAQNGVNQQAIVVQSMIDYMDRYSEWAAAGFPYNSGTAPSYIAVRDAQLAMKTAVQGQYLANSYNPVEVPCQ
jgi:hypothetical protein